MCQFIQLIRQHKLRVRIVQFFFRSGKFALSLDALCSQLLFGNGQIGLCLGQLDLLHGQKALGRQVQLIKGLLGRIADLLRLGAQLLVFAHDLDQSGVFCFDLRYLELYAGKQIGIFCVMGFLLDQLGQICARFF